MTAPQERPVVVVPARLGWANAERDKSSLRLYATDDGDSPRWDERWQGGYVVEYALPTNTGEGDRYLVVRLGDRFTDDAVTERVTAAIDAALYDAKAEPQERPVAGDGLDREAIERRAEDAAVCLALLSKPPTGCVARSAADVPALLAALRAAEAEVERLREYVAHLTGGAVVKADGPAVGKGVLRTEGGAS